MDGRESPSLAPRPDDRLRCVDLFCGVGGFSCGAVQAGHRIVLAIDRDPVAVRMHRLNHPDAVHRVMELGDTADDELIDELIAQVVPAGARWHLHMSPPCQALSGLQNCNVGRACHRPLSEGMALVNWSLRTLLRLQPPSWSFEQVACREIQGVLSFLKASFPDYVDYAKVDLTAYGLCQTRTRMLAGHPSLVQPFLSDPTLRTPPPNLSEFLQLPEGAVWQRSSVGKNPDPALTVRNADGSYSNSSSATKFLRSVHAPAWTCASSTSAHAYLTADYKTIRSFTPQETALLQTFPEFYCLADPNFTQVQLRRVAGNAYPPMIARKFMQAA